MREIKFRAWSGKREHGRYEHRMHSWEEIIESIDGESGWRKSIFSIGCDPDSEMILMQFTGIKDKNGKEIYEGDIVFFIGHNKRVIQWTPSENLYAAWYATGGMRPLPIYSKIEPNTIEVIGNMYENPELLEKK